jgi:hypothetical protein
LCEGTLHDHINELCDRTSLLVVLLECVVDDTGHAEQLVPGLDFLGAGLVEPGFLPGELFEPFRDRRKAMWVLSYVVISDISPSA